MSRRSAPPPPAGLPKRLHAAYRKVWSSSVAHLWPPDSAQLVARLVEQRDRVKRLGDDCKPAHMSVLLQLERELLLTPKSARASGITVRDEQPTHVPAAADDDGEAAARPRRRSSTARRDRVLRAVS